MDDMRVNVRSTTKTTISLWTIGVITWIVFMIGYYGFGWSSWLSTFWLWFPLWIVPAIDLAIIIIVVIIALITTACSRD